MKFCKKCHRLIAEGVENYNDMLKSCKCDDTRVITVDRGVINRCLTPCNIEKGEKRIRKAIALSLLGSELKKIAKIKKYFF